MRKIAMLLFLVMLMVATSTRAQSPNSNEWFRQKNTQRKYLVQQIAALKVYREYLKKGYEIVDKGLTTIGEIKNRTFSLDKDYFNSLKSVSPIVRNSPKVNEILAYRHAINESFKHFVAYCANDEQLTTDEVRYIEGIRRKVLHECDVAIEELTLVTTAGETEMQDEERLARLDKVHNQMQELYVFVCDFIDSTYLLSVQRRKQKDQLDLTRKLTKQT